MQTSISKILQYSSRSFSVNFDIKVSYFDIEISSLDSGLKFDIEKTSILGDLAFDIGFGKAPESRCTVAAQTGGSQPVWRARVCQ